jgi:hypothetical protein
MLMPGTLANHHWKMRKAMNVQVVLTEWNPMELSCVPTKPKCTPARAVKKNQALALLARTEAVRGKNAG